jgi:hypothetical protein
VVFFLDVVLCCVVLGVVLCWEGLEATGQTATWVRETLQNTYSTVATCESSLLVSFAHRQLRMMLTARHCGWEVLPLGSGEEWEVIEAAMAALSSGLASQVCAA